MYCINIFIQFNISMVKLQLRVTNNNKMVSRANKKAELCFGKVSMSDIAVCNQNRHTATGNHVPYGIT